jgi:TATA-binding protein-associated factor
MASHLFKCILILLSGIDVREKLARQRQLLNARLGLDVALRIGMDMSEIFSTEDLTICLEADVSRHDPVKVSMREICRH